MRLKRRVKDSERQWRGQRRERKHWHTVFRMQQKFETTAFWRIQEFYAFTNVLWCCQPVAWPLSKWANFFWWLFQIFLSSRSSSISISICLFLISGPHLNRMRSRTKGINYFSHEIRLASLSTKCDCHSKIYYVSLWHIPDFFLVYLPFFFSLLCSILL